MRQGNSEIGTDEVVCRAGRHDPMPPHPSTSLKVSARMTTRPIATTAVATTNEIPSPWLPRRTGNFTDPCLDLACSSGVRPTRLLPSHRQPKFEHLNLCTGVNTLTSLSTGRRNVR